jgi:arginase
MKPMPSNRTILTPLFLDTPVPGLETLARPGWVLNKPALPEGETQTRMGVVHRALANFTAQTLAAGCRPVSIAGDCCTAIGVAAGVQRAGLDPTLIWFDAHGDFNTPETTPSGFMGGMPLAMLTGRGDRTLAATVGLEPMPDRRIILTDGRDLDPGERGLLAQSGVVHLANPRDLIAYPLDNRPIWVHFDVDVVSLADAPAQNYPAAGGLGATALKPVFKKLARTGRLAAVSMSTWNPALEDDRQSERTCMALLQDLVGESDPS